MFLKSPHWKSATGHPAADVGDKDKLSPIHNSMDYIGI